MKRYYLASVLICILLLSCNGKRETEGTTVSRDIAKCNFKPLDLNKIYFQDKSILSISKQGLVDFISQNKQVGDTTLILEIPVQKGTANLMVRVNSRIQGLPMPSLHKVQFYTATDSLDFSYSSIDTTISLNSLNQIAIEIDELGEPLNETFYRLSILSKPSELQLNALLRDIGNRYESIINRRFSALNLDSCQMPTTGEIEKVVRSSSVELFLLYN